MSKGDFFFDFRDFGSEIGELEDFGCIFMCMKAHLSVWVGQKPSSVQLKMMFPKHNFAEASRYSLIAIASGSKTAAFYAFGCLLPTGASKKRLTNPILSVLDTPDKAKLTNSAAIPPPDTKFRISPPKSTKIRQIRVFQAKFRRVSINSRGVSTCRKGRGYTGEIRTTGERLIKNNF